MDKNYQQMYEAEMDATRERIRYLGVVGKVLNEGFSEENQDFGSNFLVAKEALRNFEEGIAKLDLDEPSREGMKKLVAYLWHKIEKREQGISK